MTEVWHTSRRATDESAWVVVLRPPRPLTRCVGKVKDDRAGQGHRRAACSDRSAGHGPSSGTPGRRPTTRSPGDGRSSSQSSSPSRSWRCPSRPACATIGWPSSSATAAHRRSVRRRGVRTLPGGRPDRSAAIASRRLPRVCAPVRLGSHPRLVTERHAVDRARRGPIHASRRPRTRRRMDRGRRPGRSSTRSRTSTPVRLPPGAGARRDRRRTGATDRWCWVSSRLCSVRSKPKGTESVISNKFLLTSNL